MIFVLCCDIISKSSEFAAMAQSVEHVIGNDEVISSILISSSRKSKLSACFFFFVFVFLCERKSKDIYSYISVSCLTAFSLKMHLPLSERAKRVFSVFVSSPNSDRKSVTFLYSAPSFFRLLTKRKYLPS